MGGHTPHSIGLTRVKKRQILPRMNSSNHHKGNIDREKEVEDNRDEVPPKSKHVHLQNESEGACNNRKRNDSLGAVSQETTIDRSDTKNQLEGTHMRQSPELPDTEHVITTPRTKFKQLLGVIGKREKPAGKGFQIAPIKKC